MVNKKNNEQDLSVFVSVIVILIVIGLAFSLTTGGTPSKTYHADLEAIALDNNLTYAEETGMTIGGTYGNINTNKLIENISINDNIENTNVDLTDATGVVITTKFKVDTNLTGNGYLALWHSIEKNGTLPIYQNMTNYFSNLVEYNIDALEMRADYNYMETSTYNSGIAMDDNETYTYQFILDLEDKKATSVFSDENNVKLIYMSTTLDAMFPNGYDLNNIQLMGEFNNPSLTEEFLMKFNIVEMTFEVME